MTGSGSAPASSANLGPGFDCLALAIDLRCRVTAHPADAWSVVSDGTDPGPDAVWFITEAARRAGGDRPLGIEVESDIPRASGLGSSAAVAAATAVAAIRAGGGDPDPGAVFEIVADLDGHPDNAGAAVYGGLVAVASRTVLRLDLSPELIPVVAVPAQTLATVEARRALPEAVTHAAAARNVARVAALVRGLETGDPKALRLAGGDELHETHRAHLSQVASRLMAAATGAGALHTSWSGAGPSVLAITTAESVDEVVAAMEAILDEGTVLSLAVAGTGID